jgi:hypothetical protein
VNRAGRCRWSRRSPARWRKEGARWMSEIACKRHSSSGPTATCPPAGTIAVGSCPGSASNWSPGHVLGHRHRGGPRGPSAEPRRHYNRRGCLRSRPPVRLSVFAGGFTLESAEMVCSDGHRPMTADDRRYPRDDRQQLAVAGRDVMEGVESLVDMVHWVPVVGIAKRRMRDQAKRPGYPGQRPHRRVGRVHPEPSEATSGACCRVRSGRDATVL